MPRTRRPTLPDDVIVLPAAGGRWVVLNVRARTAIGVETAGLEALRAAEAGQPPGGSAVRGFRVWEIGRFANREGLLADPTPYVRNAAEWPAPMTLDGDALIEHCRRELLLVDDVEAYFRRSAPKRSIVDAEHLGNFHQQLGHQLMLIERVDPARWWVDQKFAADGTIRPTLYHSVQELFLERFFDERVRPGMTVLDIGCGTGLYASRMAQRGAAVLGVDPSEEYIGVARSRGHGARFEVMRVGEPGGLDPVASGSVDLAFMSDALLFYFHPPTPDQRPDLGELLGAVHRVLRRDGVFVSMEPHPVFWLAPWLGHIDHPFTVVTEYAHRRYGVTPTTGQLVRALTSRGFAIADLVEVTAGEILPDDRATHFAAEFPLWQVVEARIS